MNQIKEKSAVGMAVPATEMENHYTTSVTDKTEKIKCVLQKPGEISVVANITNTLEAMQKIVGGDIETLTLSNGYVLVMNALGKLIGLPRMLKFYTGSIDGTVIMTRAEGDRFVSLTNEQIQEVRGWLLQHTI